MAQNKKIPKIARDADRKEIRTPQRPGKERWAFSFRFLRQIDLFGWGDQNSGWFVGLVEKLTELSKLTTDEVVSDLGVRDVWRFHPVKWTSTDCPLRRENLTWIDTEYRDNSDEYPIYQFQLTVSTGRVIGFWDENRTFNVILLDPMHNLQPSKDFDFRVRTTKVHASSYGNLLDAIMSVKKAECQNHECARNVAISALGKRDADGIIITRVDDARLARIYAIMELYDCSSVLDIFDAGLSTLEEKERS